ncbi:D-ribose pyranase [Schaalia sp. ZJ405]|nr:D-ribose pyranase [Schaalia sp. ZJ405]
MKPKTILHPELAQALAELGHTDVVLVTDAGFPIPRDARRIDLALYQDVPTVYQILRVLRQHMFAEEVHFAPEVKTHNPDLYSEIQDIYKGSGAKFIPAIHEELIEEWAPKAKVVVRSGSFEPWANFAIIASTDPFAWFTSETVTTLPAYIERREAMSKGVVPDFDM